MHHTETHTYTNSLTHTHTHAQTRTRSLTHTSAGTQKKHREHVTWILASSVSESPLSSEQHKPTSEFPSLVAGVHCFSGAAAAAEHTWLSAFQAEAKDVRHRGHVWVIRPARESYGARIAQMLAWRDACILPLLLFYKDINCATHVLEIIAMRIRREPNQETPFESVNSTRRANNESKQCRTSKSNIQVTPQTRTHSGKSSESKLGVKWVK